MAWKHDFGILVLFHQFLVSLDLFYVFKYVNPILLAYTVLMKVGECNYDMLFTYLLLAVITWQQEKIVKISVLSLLGCFYCIFSEFNCLLPFPSLDPISAPPCD